MGLPVGYDTPMITAAEDVPIENAEGSKHHRVQTSPPEFSGSPDLNGALVQLSAGLVNQASLEIRFYHPVSITADMNKGLLATFTASEVYSALSRQRVNFEKSFIYFGANVDIQTHTMSIFRPDQAEKILCIPLPSHVQPDSLFWRYDQSSIYSVKSSYRCLTDSSHSPYTTNAPSRLPSQRLFLSLWSLDLPAKIKIICWRFCNNYIPTTVSLINRRVNVSPLCTLCANEPETVEHIMKRISVKINFDAGFNSSNKSSVSGIIIRDLERLVLTSSTYLNNFISDPAVAEARACEQAVALTSELGFRRAIVEGDAISVISKMTSTKSDRSHISPIIHNVQYLTSGFESLTFNFVRRSLNPVAHSLAQLGWSFPMCMVWIEEAPHEVDALLSSDRWWVDPPD
ncbi:hypothetical protein V6N13_090682 [Hibiscus sabdariffa]